jgi:phosphate starvation-inducible protein PhoH
MRGEGNGGHLGICDLDPFGATHRRGVPRRARNTEPPDTSTAEDFCRRSDEQSILARQEGINRARLEVWQRQPTSFCRGPAVTGADATTVATDAEAKAGTDS